LPLRARVGRSRKRQCSRELARGEILLAGHLRIVVCCAFRTMEKGKLSNQEEPGKDEKSLRWPARLDKLDEAERSTLTLLNCGRKQMVLLLASG
jgi:hypothetical protein